MHQNGYNIISGYVYNTSLNFPEDNIPIYLLELCDPPLMHDVQQTCTLLDPSSRIRSTSTMQEGSSSVD